MSNRRQDKAAPQDEREASCLIVISHPSLDGDARAIVPLSSFREHWEAKGWVEVDPSTASAEQESVPAADEPTK